MTSAFRTVSYARLFSPSPEKVPRIREIDDLAPKSAATPDEAQSGRTVAYAIFDRQTSDWGNNGFYTDENNLPGCWIHVGDLQPEGMGFAVPVVRQLAAFATLLPGGIGQRLSARLDSMLNPLPASISRKPGAALSPRSEPQKCRQSDRKSPSPVRFSSLP